MRNDDYWGPKPYFKYVRIRIIPEQATQIAELISGGVDIIKAVPARPDGRDQQVGPGPHRDLADPAHRDPPARPGRARGPEPLPGQARAAGREPRRRHRLDHQARDQRPRRPHGDHHQSDGLRLGPGVKPYKQDLAQAKKLLAEAGFPNGVEVGFMRGPADRRAGRHPDVRRHRRRPRQGRVSGPSSARSARTGPFTNLVRDNKADPMFDWSWGYYSVFDADAILYDVMKCGAAVQLLLQQGARRPDHPGPLDPRQQEAARSTPRPRASSTRTPPTSTSGACAASGASATGRLRGAARRDRPDVHS